jgi:hypothetical protein
MAIDSTDCLCWASQIGFLEVWAQSLT